MISSNLFYGCVVIAIATSCNWFYFVYLFFHLLNNRLNFTYHQLYVDFLYMQMIYVGT
jgi:hypothetical protein